MSNSNTPATAPDRARAARLVDWLAEQDSLLDELPPGEFRELLRAQNYQVAWAFLEAEEPRLRFAIAMVLDKRRSEGDAAATLVGDRLAEAVMLAATSSLCSGASP